MPSIGPYTWTEALGWLYRYLLGPTCRHAALTPWLPRVTTPAIVEPRLKVILGGDVMSNKGKALRVTDELAEFFSGADHLVLNLEGILSEERDLVLVKQYSSPRLLDDLDALFPLERIILSVANNHAADYGMDKLRATVEQVEARGGRVIGTRETPGTRLGEQVYLHAATELSNRPTEALAILEEARPDPACDLNLLYPHGGEEFVVYPSPARITADRPLLRDWDLVAWHHSHCPGPVAAYQEGGRRGWIAWSLGDFSVFFTARAIRYGQLLALTLGPDETGRWRIGRIERRFSWVERADSREIRVGLREDCPVV